MSLHIRTPLVHSEPMSKLCDRTLLLKLENLQPSGSFKIRGIGNMVQKATKNNILRLVSPSGGNAGLAALYAARAYNLPITIVVPNTTPNIIIQKMEEGGATVMVEGCNWDESNEFAHKISQLPGHLLVPPYDHTDIWDGHSSLISELEEQPAAVVVSVGGGGLATGVIQGLQNRGWHDTVVITMETSGADCFNAAIQRGKLITLKSIDSIATTLGARQACEALFSLAKSAPVISKVVSDEQAVGACLKFADDHRMLVEPACGAALAAVYSNIVKDVELRRDGAIVVVVCGGSGVTINKLQEWATQLNIKS